MRPLAALLLAAMMLIIPTTPAIAGRKAAPGAASNAVCTIGDGRLDELSGLAPDGDGYVTMNDSTDIAGHRRIFFLDRRCKVTRSVGYPSRPRDPEDLARTPDGTVWVGDIGDNNKERTTVAVWRLPRGAKSPTLYRLSYPDGAHDAEAMLVTADGRPIIIAKDPFRPAVYTTAGALKAGGVTRLTLVGICRLPTSDTSNPFGLAGRVLVTGAALSPAGDRVAVRTYADAFEFKVTGGDVVRALTGGDGARVPLPDEPQGEAVAYAPDGRSLLTVSEKGESAGKPAIKRYPTAIQPPPPPTTAAPPAKGKPAQAEPGPAGDAAKPVKAAWLPPLGLGVLGAVAVLFLAVAVIRRSRRAR